MLQDTAQLQVVGAAIPIAFRISLLEFGRRRFTF